MLSTARSRAACLLSKRVSPSARRAYAHSANENKEINVSDAPKQVPNVSKTNELPMENPFSSEALQETVEEAEEVRSMQSPNRKETWSRSQNPRARAMSGPRFEQTIMKYQVGYLGILSLYLVMLTIFSTATTLRCYRPCS